jgi:two-component system, NtrC family, response regulator AtoC
VATPKVNVPELPPDEVVFGCSEEMKEVQQKIQRIASTTVPVLIRGESGTGKEVIAKLLHQRTGKKSVPFVKINCPAIPGPLMESELFGYEKGAFTGADGKKLGLVELAHGGTLFMDEIAELDFGLQSKLLQLLQEGQFYRIGGQKERQVEVRFICATNRHLEQAIQAGTFRHDLFYRIKVVTLTLPALRNRGRDIPILIEHFLRNYSREFARHPRPLSAATMDAMQTYSWPGNIRELENLIKSYVILDSEDVIRGELLNGENGNGLAKDDPTSLKAAVRALENRLILRTLEQHHWNRRRAARALEISYRALLYRLKQSEGLLSERLHARPQTGND